MPNKLLLAAALSGFALTVAPAAAETRQVVELFTSQGCNSCPPADQVLADLAKRPDVLALAYHVDYWDRLGWKDTLGSPAHTARQRAYAAARGDGQVYTPQAIVGGDGHLVGSRGGAISGLLGGKLPVDVGISGGRVSVGSGAGPATLWRVDFTRHADVPIGRGENAGRTITYVNSVRGMTKIGDWSGASAIFELGACGSAEGADDCAVILQAGQGPGTILGAARR